jgi:hypothetical protein
MPDCHVTRSTGTVSGGSISAAAQQADASAAGDVGEQPLWAIDSTGLAVQCAWRVEGGLHCTWTVWTVYRREPGSGMAT